MISDNYINNIYNRSIVDFETNGETYIIKVTLPNSYVLCIVGESIEQCVRMAKDKIRELELYLETDKKYYNYDLGNEYE